MKPSTGRGIDEDSANLGETQLIATLLQLELPQKYTMMQRMDDIKAEVISIEKIVKPLLEKAKDVQSAERSLQVANESFMNMMGAWTEIEKSNVRSLAGYAFDEKESIVPTKTMTESTLLHFSNLYRTKVRTVIMSRVIILKLLLVDWFSSVLLTVAHSDLISSHLIILFSYGFKLS